MNPAQAAPCHQALDSECFEAHPEQARRLFAIKLLFTLFPGEITRRLLKLLGIDLLGLLDQLDLPTEDLLTAEDFANQAWNAGRLAQERADQAQQDADQAQQDADQAQTRARSAWALRAGAAPEDQAALLADAMVAQEEAEQAQQDADKAQEEADQAQEEADQAQEEADDADKDAAEKQREATQTDEPPEDAQQTGTTEGPLPVIWDQGPPTPPPEEEVVPLPITLPPIIWDGYVKNSDSTWPITHGAAEGDHRAWMDQRYSSAFCAYESHGDYAVVRRAFLYFDLTTIPAGAQVTGATLSVYGYQNAGEVICIQCATPSGPLEKADYTSFFGPMLLQAVWLIGWNVFNLHSYGVAHINQQAPGFVAFCIREFEHDYRNIRPPHQTAYQGGMYFSNAVEEVFHPTLDVTFD